MHQCPVCDKVFSRRFNMTRHINRLHLGDQSDDSLSQESKEDVSVQVTDEEASTTDSQEDDTNDDDGDDDSDDDGGAGK